MPKSKNAIHNSYTSSVKGYIHEDNEELIDIVSISAIGVPGVIARQRIEKGTLLGKYTGVSMTADDVSNAKNQYDNKKIKDDPYEYLFNLPGNTHIDARTDGNFTRFINTTSVGLFNVVFNAVGEVYAKKDILPGTQLLIDYGLNYPTDGFLALRPEDNQFSCADLYAQCSDEYEEIKLESTERQVFGFAEDTMIYAPKNKGIENENKFILEVDSVTRKVLDDDKQARVTAFMLWLFQKDANIINKLKSPGGIKYYHDLLIFQSRNDQNALFYLLDSKNEAVISDKKFMQALLNGLGFKPFESQNKQNHNIFHSAIKNKMYCLFGIIPTMKKKSQSHLEQIFFQVDNDDFDLLMYSISLGDKQATELVIKEFTKLNLATFRMRNILLFKTKDEKIALQEALQKINDSETLAALSEVLKAQENLARETITIINSFKTKAWADICRKIQLKQAANTHVPVKRPRAEDVIGITEESSSALAPQTQKFRSGYANVSFWPNTQLTSTDLNYSSTPEANVTPPRRP